VELEQAALLPLCWCLQARKGESSGISFVDSITIAVCPNLTAAFVPTKCLPVGQAGQKQRRLVLRLQASSGHQRPRGTAGLQAQPGTVDDRVPVPEMVKQLSGKLFGDKGYISQKLLDLLFGQDLHLVTKMKATMKNQLMPLFDKILLRKRAVSESVTDQLKNISQIEHTRHRSLANFLVNVIAGLIAYTYREKKPSLDIRVKELGGSLG